MGKADREIIWISGESWDRYAGAHRDMAVAMSKHARILWVDPPVSPVSVARRRKPVSALRPTVTKVTDRITRLTTVGPPGMTRPIVRAATTRMMRAQIKWAANRLAVTPSAVVMAYLADLLDGWGDDVTSVLYGTDDFVAGAELMGLAAGEQRKREQRALTSADVVVTVTEELARSWSKFGANPLVIPNGCWPSGTGVVEPSEAALGLPRPVVGLVGYLSGRIDIDMLEAVSHSGYSLLLAGPVDSRWESRRFGQLISRSTVRYIGPVASSDVPALLAAVDVGITPYRDTEFNRASFPLKTLEYLGAGLPAVSSSLPAARWLRTDLESQVSPDVADQALMLADTPHGLVDAIRTMTMSGRNLASHRIEFAKRHSWPRRAEQLAAAIGPLIPDRPSNRA